MYWDIVIFQAVNGLAGRWIWLDFLAVFCASGLGYVLLLCLAALLAIDAKKYWRTVAEAVVASVLVRFVVIETIYWLWFRARPFVDNQVRQLIEYTADKPSLPSGHASFYFALSTIVFCHDKRVGVVFYLASFVIAISRVFVGVHWPSDILAGALLGTLAAWVIHRLWISHYSSVKQE